MLNNDQSDAPMMWSALANPQAPATSEPYTPIVGAPVEAHALAPQASAGEQSWDDMWQAGMVGLPPAPPLEYENSTGDSGAVVATGA